MSAPGTRAAEAGARAPGGRLVLLTGATGYIGGRLLPRLEARGERVRCLARRPGHLAGRVGPGTEVIAGDLLEAGALGAAFAGVDTAYYLVHAMASAGRFEEEEAIAARHFAAAAREAGARRIIYLGGLGAPDDGGTGIAAAPEVPAAGLSAHLRSRQEVGAILRASGVPAIEFRAGVVLGSGSLSFEMIRALVERLPVMITPRWVDVPTQPIAVDDLLAYLVAALDAPPATGGVIEIGCPEPVTYRGLMREYARQRGLRRLLIPVPFLTPRLSGLWLGLVTPLYARIGRRLIDSLRVPTVVRDPVPAAAFAVAPRGHGAAIADALRHEDRAFAATRWCDALSASPRPRSFGGERFGSRLVDSRAVAVAVPPARAFAPIRRIGGAAGWYHADRLWRLRGVLDLLAGGPGLRRGRRDPERLAPGDVVDCWRVEAIEPDRRLRLAAEMRLPGRAWLEFEVEPRAGGALIRQTALFDPAGLAGRAYWYLIYPLHAMVFAGMLRALAREAGSAPPHAPGPGAMAHQA